MWLISQLKHLKQIVTTLVILEKLADKLQKKRPKKNLEDLEYSDLLAQEPEIPDFMKLPESETESEPDLEPESVPETQPESENESETDSENEAEIEAEIVAEKSDSEPESEHDFEDDSEDSEDSESDVDEPLTIVINPNYFHAGSDSENDSDSDSEIVFREIPMSEE